MPVKNFRLRNSNQARLCSKITHCGVFSACIREGTRLNRYLFATASYIFASLLAIVVTCCTGFIRPTRTADRTTGPYMGELRRTITFRLSSKSIAGM